MEDDSERDGKATLEGIGTRPARPGQESRTLARGLLEGEGGRKEEEGYERKGWNMVVHTQGRRTDQFGAHHTCLLPVRLCQPAVPVHRPRRAGDLQPQVKEGLWTKNWNLKGCQMRNWSGSG